MARGGGGGGRGGGGGGRSFSGARYRSASQNDQTTPTNKFVDFIFTAVIIILVLSISSGNSRASYDETKLSDFASDHYEASFGNTESYEDNLLLAFVVYEDCEQFSYMTWVGDHIGPDAFQYLQGEGTWLDIMLSRQVGAYYRNSLSADLDRAVRELAQKLGEVDPVGSLSCGEDSSSNPTALRNRSDLDLNAQQIEEALRYFRETTGIPIVLVIEDAADIFQ